jgi:hypothetical protein
VRFVTIVKQAAQGAVLLLLLLLLLLLGGEGVTRRSGQCA